MRDPLDIDQHWPKPLTRDEAAAHLESIIPSGYVDAVWDELIAPLYDARRFTAEWPRGTCKRCYVRHPAHPMTGPGRDTGHRMRCPKYVGPLTHKKAHSHRMAYGNYKAECSCGKSYDEYDDDGNPNSCPDAAVDWRGPRT